MDDENVVEKLAASEMPHYDAAVNLAQRGPMEISAVAHTPTVSEMLQHKKLQLEYQLKCVNDAIAKAKEQEGAVGLLDSLAKAHVLR